ncbi:MAG: acyltransferase [Oxalobacteraceae bacterium]|nr:MAG: acyltransferase [Oxalobacteraceae bacterium]
MTIERSASVTKSLFSGNFGALRLLMSCLVIVGHTPELIDGNRHREIFTQLFGTMSFGELAVDGFFLISGYMLALSVEKSGTLARYFIKRVARIYPAFIVSFVLCLVIVTPLAAGSIDTRQWQNKILKLFLLQPPHAENVFVGAPHPALNGAMWTISYEFMCYVLLAAAFALGLLRRRRILIAGVTGLLVLLVIQPHLDLATREITFGQGAQNTLRFVAAFCTGVGYRKLLTTRWLNGWVALLGLVVLGFTLFNPFLAEPSLILIGGYVLIYVGELNLGQLLSRIGQEIDLSYGIYLYAWPVQSLAIWKFGLRDIIQVDILTIAITGMLALLSWTLIERPARTSSNSRSAKYKSSRLSMCWLIASTM